MTRISVLGTTTWGTTLAIILAKQGFEVILLARTKEEAENLASQNCNTRFLPNTPFPPNLRVHWDPDQSIPGSTLLILAIPSNTLRDNVKKLGGAVGQATLIMSATKGLEISTSKRMSQILEEELPAGFSSRICVLSGPNFASDIILGRPTSTVIACSNRVNALKVQRMVTIPNLRVYINTDVVGVELGGALKNIIAIGAGLCDGLKYGDNAKAAFLTRGLAEMSRLGEACGAKLSTFAGMAGLGDLIATCTSPRSRNRYVGERIAEGHTLHEIQASMNNVAEGVNTTVAAMELSQRINVEMPITAATYRVLFEALDPKEAVMELMERHLRSE